MKRDNINYLVVGVFVLATLGVLLGVLYKLTGRVGDSEAYHVHYGNITGLSDGSRVTYEGYQVGFVAGVVPEQGEAGTRYRVELRIKRDWRIPADSVARIYSAGLLAETVINIEEGASRERLAPGAEIAGAQGEDLFAAMGGIASDLGELTREGIRPLIDNLNRTVSGLGGELEARVPRLLGELESILHKLDQGADGLARLLDTDNTQRVTSIVADVEASARDFRALSAGLRGTQAQLDALLGEAQAVVGDNRGDLRQSVQALRRTLDSVAREVDGILYGLEGSSRNLHEFTRELRGNPGLLLRGGAAAEQGVNGD
ncbi:MAG: MlaD family protein [Gammaproteobacteria bacterium]